MVVRLASLTLGLCLICSIAGGNDMTHPRIPGFERFYAAPLPKHADEDAEPIKLDPITGGRILLTELNCTSCHAPAADAKVHLAPKKAPVLDEVGSRVKVGWLRAFLASPHAIKPGTTMPDLISTLPETSRAASVEALTHFLASTGALTEARPDAAAAKRGEEVFRKVGCLACHNGIDEKSPDVASSVALPDLGKKYSAPSLMEFLKDPLKARPAGRMPDLALSEEELRSIGNYFVRDGVTTPNVKYSLYYGNWNALPKFSDLKAIAVGESSGFDLSVANRGNDFGIRFVSYLRIMKSGEYRFWLASDDGSKLIVDDEVVVDCDGIHPHERRNGQKTLTAGFHRVVVEYFDAGGQISLAIQIAGQGLPRQPLAGLMYLEPQVPVSTSDKPVFSVDENLVAKGRELFATIGCASCHQMTVEGQLIASKFQTKPLAEVSTNVGCLAEKVSGKAPRFRLSAVQRASLAAALKSRTEEKPAETIHRSLATMNCYACHERSKLGGVEEARNASFETLQKEMGDEGRLPPTLTGVGDKLRPEWLRNLLNNGANDRKNYMVTRMPKFGTANVDSFVDLFGAVDLRPESMPKADFSEPDYRVKAAGRHLVGGAALSCIKCHDFGTHPSTGVRAINLTTMHQRLRPDWFYRYVLDPQVYRRGTRMPAPWPSGQATIRDTLNADVNLQIQAVMLYLADRDKASVPSGLLRELIELKPQTEPVLYRNFIEGAGTRAIGVGYPEGVNLAFDANEMRLAMIWHGAFIDASRHWTGRGAGFEPPLGDDIIPLPGRVPFLALDKPDREFPIESARDVGYRFQGYFLDAQQRPVFRYTMPGLDVEDHFIPEKSASKSASLQRTLKFAGTADTSQLWFRAAVAGSLEDVSKGRFRIDNVWTLEVEVSGQEKPIVRDSAGKKELLVPIRLQNAKAEVALNYVW